MHFNVQHDLKTTDFLCTLFVATCKLGLAQSGLKIPIAIPSR